MILQVEQARFTLPAIMVERDLDVGNSSETLMSVVGEVLMQALYSRRWIFEDWNSGASVRTCSLRTCSTRNSSKPIFATQHLE